MSTRQDRSGLGRRRFLTTAALSGATIVGASALGGLDADAAFAAEPSLDPAIAKSSFVEGRITGITGSILEVAGSQGGHSRVQMTNATSVWKGRATTAAVIEIGDGLYARGVDMPDGVVAADAVWVNIVNLDTQIRGIAKNRIHLAHGQHELVGNVLADTSASYAGRGLTSDLSRLRIGQHAQVLGAWRPSDDSVDVVRISVGH
ncbi:cell wall protein [Streptomyces physcomitrii]|uniref:Cell wall protein n=1 Tax=Streptomyces physcomitrii TaxID=2724184 RepID=A0ABX1H3S0_9ACTN|nr:cell wall protein [Streptomyces physcomitrii]NKI43007.1 cell wall protein [Streptomyces physcomitrii]